MDDILFDDYDFILEIETGTPGGTIVSYSMDGFGYDFTSSVGGGGEVAVVFIS